MSTYKFRASGIRENEPTVKKTVILRTTCDKCNQDTLMKAEFTSNAEEVLIGDLKANCGNKKCKATISFNFMITMPKK